MGTDDRDDRTDAHRSSGSPGTSPLHAANVQRLMPGYTSTEKLVPESDRLLRWDPGPPGRHRRVQGPDKDVNALAYPADGEGSGVGWRWIEMARLTAAKATPRRAWPGEISAVVLQWARRTLMLGPRDTSTQVFVKEGGIHMPKTIAPVDSCA
jgi:hypothetical protein